MGYGSERPSTAGYAGPGYSTKTVGLRVAVDETVIRLDDEQYWLCATVGAGTNESLHTNSSRPERRGTSNGSFRYRREKRDVDDAVFLVDGVTPLKDACRRYGLEVGYETTGTRTGAKRIQNIVKS